MPDRQQLEQWDRDHFLHSATHLGQFARAETPQRVIARGEGVPIEGRDGNRFLDASAGLYRVNAGYGRIEIAPEQVVSVTREAVDEVCLSSGA